ncbi:hypothetical protein EXE43_07070 [Halorubrum sp. SS5]|nr:hypothetical protein EXE43_07070 [Halorubrum sp. SS5]
MNRFHNRRFGIYEYNRDGVDVYREDWDNLVIIDACRKDLFREVFSEYEVKNKISRGSNTPEFLKGNFENSSHGDTVYISANPHVGDKYEDLNMGFHEVIDLSKEQWDAEAGTVLPEVTTEKAIEASKEYPNKRIIVHYMQPHLPFIGELGSKLDLPDDPWDALMKNENNINLEEVIEAYIENIELVKPFVEELSNNLVGKTVVTSDHGNMLGETSYPIPIHEFGHPSATYTDELVTVPWVAIEYDNRREIRSETITESVPNSHQSEVDSRLKSLGYLK